MQPDPNDHIRLITENRSVPLTPALLTVIVVGILGIVITVVFLT